jgi:hypothetical protein
VRKIWLDPEGRIILLGHSSVGGKNGFSVQRLMKNGTPDGNFVGDGLHIGEPAERGSILAALITASGEAIFTGSRVREGNGDFCIARFRFP